MDRNGIALSDTFKLQAVNARDIRLTIDAVAQERALQALDGKRGAIVAMDVESGEVYVLASFPTTEYCAIASAYSPGTIFQVVTGTAALQEGKIESGTTFNCEESIVLGGYEFCCWIFEHGHGHGPQDVIGALQRCCNIFFYNCGKRTGMPSLRQWCINYGLGVTTGIDLPREVAGRIPSPTMAAKATLSEVLNHSIGQGELLVTPLQIARMFAAIANGGKVLRPHILLHEGAIPEYKDLRVREETLKLLRQGMSNVINNVGGLAFAGGMNNFQAVGTTGKALTVRGQPKHAWFGCYFPEKLPRFALCVFIEQNDLGHTATVAAALAVPVAKALEQKYLGAK